MTALISFLIFALEVCFFAIVIIYVVQTILAAMTLPANAITIARMIIILIAFLFIMNRALPFIGAYS